MAELPTGTVTFLFTDVEGSTRLWEQDPDAMRQALTRHDAIVEAEVERHGGAVVRPRGEGDSRFAVFGRASDALAAAGALQDALELEPWPTSAPLRVRAALHTGEAQFRDGDYYGAAVNRGARLRSIARGGQTLLSGVTAGLVRDALPPDSSLRGLGARRLKDLQRPEQVFQLVRPAPAAPLPLTTTSDAPATDGPAPTAVFVGREAELEVLRAHLDDACAGQGGVTLLVGDPGIGKTRTAEELAAYARSRQARVLWGRCYEGEGAPAFWPWVQLIRTHARDREPDLLASEMGPRAAVIAEVVSEIHERLASLPTPPPLEPAPAEETGDRELALQGLRWHVPNLLELGDMPAVDREVDVHARLAEELRQPLYLWDAVRWQAMRALLEGRFQEGERLAQQALELGRRALSGTATIYVLLHMFTLRREQGCLAEMEADVRSLVEGQPGLPGWRCWLAELHSELGHEAEARRELERLAANDFAALPRDLLWLPAVSRLSEVCAFLGDAGRAAALYGLMLPYAGRSIVVGSAVLCYGAAARYLGLLATTAVRWDEAERHFEDALGMNARLGARPFVAHTQHEYGRMLLTRDEPGDREKALALLAQALDTGQQLGMTRLVEQVLAQRGLGERAGRDAAPVGRRARTRGGESELAYPGGLTPREVEVLRQVAGGRTNREIAEELVLSIRTVENHIFNLYAKIDARGRVDAAAYALRHGLL